MTILVAISVNLRIFVHYIVIGRSCPLANSVDVDFNFFHDQIVVENPNVLMFSGRKIQLVLRLVKVRTPITQQGHVI